MDHRDEESRKKQRKWDIKKRARFWPTVNLSPPQLFASSFFLLIVIGTLGLKLLPGLYDEEDPISWVDAFFTVTSSVCVTGLIVKDTAVYFTFLGQLYLLVLIQLGGLGMIAFTSVIIRALGRRLSLHHEAISSASAESIVPEIDSRRLVYDVIRFTFLIEGIGALALYVLWIPHLNWDGAFWPAIFHSVSAFCNAGFSIFSESLVDYQQSPMILMVIMALIIAGGLGFLTMEEVHQKVKIHRLTSIRKLSLHSRLVLSTTVILVLGGAIVFLCAEWNHTFKDMGLLHKITNGLFLSVTPRTAGFNTISYANATETTCFATILLMVVGGSPGSTAGGIKTTTFALLGIVAWSRFRGERTTTLWNRSVREETINRTIGLVVIVFGVIVIGVLALTVTEYSGNNRDLFLEHSFEVVSAVNTVGLSMNYTANLTFHGRILMILLMFVGRVGPLTFAAALAFRYSRAGRFRYAYEEVVVG